MRIYYKHIVVKEKDPYSDKWVTITDEKQKVFDFFGIFDYVMERKK